MNLVCSCFVLFRVILLSIFKNHQRIEFLSPNISVQNLPPITKEDVTAIQEKKLLAFSSYILGKLKFVRFFLSNYVPEKTQVSKKGGSFFNLHLRKLRKK